ncbi:MAG TPA: NADP-dependent malic enzyme, partial [Gammaproteobacteria bacterium]|nr:NADP-dependent malic enzyme [Gammaproteobacteria bacterium]
MRIPEILLIESHHKPGSLAKILQVIGEAGVVVENLNAVRREQDKTVWEVTVEMDEEADRSLFDKINELPNAKNLGKSDRVFERHKGGKIEMVSKVPLDSTQRLRDLYTPGVARVSLAIQQDPAKAWDYTNIGNTVGIVTNGTAILGLGPIGSLAGLPVMEGKSMIYAKFTGISGIPILLNDRDPKKIIDTVLAIESSFGAIHLEDIGAPECFEVEEELVKRLKKPVLHDDQHGTAVVTLAGLISACKQVKRDLKSSVVGQIGLG